MSVTTSPNMSLPIPGVGTEDGPDYALDVNTALTLVDQHDHSSGKGVQITPAGLNINADLSIGNNDLVNVTGISLTPVASNATLTSLYSVGADLYFTDGNGTAIPITANGAVFAPAASIPGQSYAAGVFTWKQGSGSTTPANFDIGSVTIRPNTAATTNGVTVTPPAGIGSAYSIALPTLPASNKFLAIDAAGAMSPTVDVSGGITTANISSSAGILGSQLANGTITSTQIGVGAIDGSDTAAGGNIQTGSITGASIHSKTIDPTKMTSSSYFNVNSYAGSASLSTSTLISSSVAFAAGGKRPVMFWFSGTSGNGNIVVAAGQTLTFVLTFDGVTINRVVFAPVGNALFVPLSALNTVYLPVSTASSFNYSLSVTVSGAGTSTMAATTLQVVQV